jgi:hypothetical protein
MKPDSVLPDWIASSKPIFGLAELIDELVWIYQNNM